MYVYVSTDKTWSVVVCSQTLMGGIGAPSGIKSKNISFLLFWGKSKTNTVLMQAGFIMDIKVIDQNICKIFTKAHPKASIVGHVI